MYDTLTRTVYSAHMFADVSYIVFNRASCVRNNLKYRHRRNMRLYSISGLLELVAMEVLRPFPKTGEGN